MTHGVIPHSGALGTLPKDLNSFGALMPNFRWYPHYPNVSSL